MKTLKKILFVMTVVIISPLIIAQQAWFVQPSGVTQQLNSVSFANSNSGWAVGNNGTIINTTNGGFTWSQQNSATNSNLYSVCFNNLSTTGWAAGADGVIEFTSNGGINWSLQQNNIPDLSLYALNIIGTTVYAVGFETNLGAAIEKTSNTGLNWTKINYDIAPVNTFNSVNFPSTTSGWIVTGGGRIFHTINGFIITDQVSGVTSPLYSVFFTDNFTGYITGANGVILKTSNGSTWTSQQSFVNVSLMSVNFPSPLNGWIVGGNGTVLKTSNGGTNWNSQNSGVTVNLRSVKFVNDLTGWAIGDSGKIIATGGITGINSNNHNTPINFSLSQNYPNPFNPSSIINYQLPKNSYVKLTVYDILGNELKELVNEQQNAGKYQVEFNGSNFSSGIYLYKLETEGFSQTKRMILIK